LPLTVLPWPKLPDRELSRGSTRLRYLPMPSFEQRKQRREAFLDRLQYPTLLFAGGQISRNYPANPYPYRADSSFAYFFANPEPGAVALFDPEARTVTLFLPERTAAEALWHGPVPSFQTIGSDQQVDAVLAVEQLDSVLPTLLKGRGVSALAVADHRATAMACRLTGQDLCFDDPARVGDPELVTAIARLRLQKDDSEIAEMRKTAAVTREAHVSAITHTRPGVYEQELAGIVDGTFLRHGCVPAYQTILTVRGEVLHNHSHQNLLRETDIVLLDGGAEAASGYCSDVTRCWPVSGRFSPEGRDIYDLVLRAELAAIAAVQPGIAYRDVHRTACLVIAEGLLDLGLLKGNAEDLVDSGAHALFFPHGIGHQIGLDVHDMEAFGDLVHYPTRARSPQFGTAYLRMDMDLEAGMTFTIEPGIYFVPAILHDETFRRRHRGHVDFERAESFLTMHGLRGFGGIRIEDDVLCTHHGAEVLTAAIPKDRAIVEAMVGAVAR
jgi:Xaa-Pro aminopeptidase